MTAPTTKCFLRCFSVLPHSSRVYGRIQLLPLTLVAYNWRFARSAQACDEDPALHLEFLANYIAELSLLEYSLLSYPPSLIAASAIFLARFVLQPTKYPWNSTLAHYTHYKPSELSECVKTLHRLSSVGPGSNLPSIREKYS
uniref:Cyclin-A1-1 n=1 Tax=Zea mays TaxID=4577 RepID=A0A804NT29_MAIZE